MTPGGTRRPGRLPLPDRRAHPGRGAGAAASAAAAGRAGADRRLLRRDGYPAYTTSPGWLGYSDEQAGPAGQAGGRRRLHPDQAEGRRRRSRTTSGGCAHRPRRGRRRTSASPSTPTSVWDVPSAIDWMQRAGAVRPVLDRGADQPGRHPRPRRRSAAAVRAGPGRHRRARRQPGRLQAAAAGRRRSTSCRSTPRRVGGVNENLAILLLAAKFGVPVCPHAGGVGLCELVQHLSMFDYVGGLRHHARTASSSTSTTCTSTSPRPSW